MQKLNLVKDSTELRKTIAENPDLPIVVMVGREAALEEFGYTYCEVVIAEVGEILDCHTPWNECGIYNDRIEFEEDLADYLCEEKEYAEISDEGLEKVLEEEKAKYEPYWIKAIIVKADNY